MALCYSYWGCPAVVVVIATVDDAFCVTAIGAALRSVPPKQWDMIREQSLRVKQAVYGVGVVQGLLMARQMLGTRGTTQFYPLSTAQLVQAINIMASPHFSSVAGPGEALVDKLCKALCQVSPRFLTDRKSLRAIL